MNTQARMEELKKAIHEHEDLRLLAIRDSGIARAMYARATEFFPEDAPEALLAIQNDEHVKVQALLDKVPLQQL